MDRYKKLFDIKFNNKIFTIFLSTNKRKVFLEKDENGKYMYPTFEDFKVLDTIYNIHNPFISYDDKKVFFKEKVRLASGILALVVSVTSLVGLLNVKYRIENGKVLLVYDENLGDTLVFSNTKSLDELLGYTTVTKEVIFESIDNNPNLNEYHKILARNLVSKYLEVVPNADLRIFNENIKTLKIVELDEREEKEVLGENIAGNYDALNNQINLQNGYLLNTIYHELAHTTQEFYYEIDGEKKLYRYKENIALNEAMNNKIVELLIDPTSYNTQSLLLDYLLSFVDFSLEDYSKYGIDELIKRLETKYPDIDFDYISGFINALTDTSNSLGYEVSITSSMEYLDELFKLCLSNVNINGNVYEPFTYFIKLLDNDKELINTYLDKYNDYLNELSYSNIITVSELNNISDTYKDYEYVSMMDEKPYLTSISGSGRYTDITFAQYDGRIDIDYSDIHYVSNLNTYLRINYLKHKDLYGTQEFLVKLVSENSLIEDYKYKKIPIYLNGEFLGEEYLQDLEVGVSKDSNGNISFELFKSTDPIDYQNYLARVPLLNYLALYKFDQNIELSYVFNDAYLKYLEERYDLYKNVVINDDNIIVIPNSKLHITDDNTFYSLELCQIYKYNGVMTIKGVNIPIDLTWDGDDFFVTNLINILNYYNMLDENTDIYAFSKEELQELVMRYINDTVLNKDASLGR